MKRLLPILAILSASAFAGAAPRHLLPGSRLSLDPHTFGQTFPSPYGATTPLYWYRNDYFYSDLGTTLCNNGDKVEQMSDISGNGHDATQTTSGNRPTYTTNSLGTQAGAVFVAANSQYLENGVAVIPKTIIVVASCTDTSTTAYESIVGVKSTTHGTPNFDCLYFTACRPNSDSPALGTLLIDSGNGTHTAYQGRTWGGQYYIQAMRYDGTTVQTEVNGAITATATCSTNLTPANNCIGSAYYNGSAVGNNLDGGIVEVLAYTTRLSDNEIATVYTALKNRYWPAITPAVYNFPIFSSANSTPDSGEEYARFFTSTDGHTLTEYPFSIVSPTITTGGPSTGGAVGLVRDWGIMRVAGTYYAFCADGNPASSTNYNYFLIYQSDRLNGPYKYLTKVDCSSLGTGAGQCVWHPAPYYDPAGRSIYVLFTEVPQNGGNSNNIYPAYVKANDNTMTSWGTPTAMGGSAFDSGYTFDPVEMQPINGTYYLWTDDRSGGPEIVTLFKSTTSPVSGFNTKVGHNYFGANDGNVEGPSIIPNGNIYNLYLGGFQMTPEGFYYSQSSSFNLETATWSTPPVQITASTGQALRNTTMYVPAWDPPSGSTGGLLFFGVGVALADRQRTPWDFSDLYRVSARYPYLN